MTKNKKEFKPILPHWFLKQHLNTEIIITPKKGVKYVGTLQGYDNHMNIILKNTNGKNMLIRGDIIKILEPKTPETKKKEE